MTTDYQPEIDLPALAVDLALFARMHCQTRLEEARGEWGIAQAKLDRQASVLRRAEADMEAAEMLLALAQDRLSPVVGPG